MPFVEAAPPTLGDVAGDLGSWRGAPEPGTA
jgi:putative membrane protein